MRLAGLFVVFVILVGTIIVVSLLFIRPTTVNEPTQTDPLSGGRCQSDADCIRTGCSSQLCVHRSQAPVVTTCEWTPEYGCRADDTCGCVAGQCQWLNNSAFQSCLERSASATGAP